MCGDAYVRDCFQRHGSKADIAVVEGVMGLYDGDLSTARLSGVLGLPGDPRRRRLRHGGERGRAYRGASGNGGERPVPQRWGVIFTRVASGRHYERLTQGSKRVNLLGYVPRDAAFEIPHRHSG